MKDDLVDKIVMLMGNIASEMPRFETKNIHKRVPVDMSVEDSTRYVVREMLKEHTGKFVSDSGYNYGYKFEKARQVDDWKKIPKIEYDELDEAHYINIYPYLTENLEYDPITDKKFAKFASKEEDWGEEMIPFLKKNAYDYHCEGTYGKETDLGGMLYYCIGKKNTEEIILLQTHNGSDVRWGYSTPHAFRFQYPLDSDDFLAQQQRE